MLAEEEDDEENSIWKFFSLYNDMILNKRILKARRKRCMEFMGWLIMVGEGELVCYIHSLVLKLNYPIKISP